MNETIEEVLNSASLDLAEIPAIKNLLHLWDGFLGFPNPFHGLGFIGINTIQ